MSAIGGSPPPPPPGSMSGSPASPPTQPPATGAGMSGGRRKTAWMAHVKATMRANKGMKLKQVLKMAKKTYKKTMRGGAQVLTPSPLNGGRRRRRGSTRRSRRGGDE